MMTDPPVLPSGVLKQLYGYLLQVLGEEAQEQLILHPPSNEWLTYHVELNGGGGRCSFDAWAESGDEIRVVLDRSFHAYIRMEFSAQLLAILDAVVAGALVIIELRRRHLIISDGETNWDHNLKPINPPQEVVSVSSYRAWND